MIVVRQRPALTAGAVLVGVLTLLYLASPRSSSLSSSASAYIPAALTFPSSSTTPPSDIGRVANTTLGFSKVFVIGLPERSDKRDALTLASALTGFRPEWVPGVRGESIPDKAVPAGVDRKKLMETNLGSWRGHMDAVRRIVDEGLASALVLEDDMDWDVRLKDVLAVVAAGVRAVAADMPDALFPGGRGGQGEQHHQQQPVSPYGDDWDLLWLGHCGEPFAEDLREHRGLAPDDPARLAMARAKFAVPRDPTVPPPGHVTGLVNFTAHPAHTRWVHVSAAPICTFAYALSQRGARKVLFDLSVDGLSGPFDNALASLCRRAVGGWGRLLKGEEGGDRGLDAKCFSVTPPVFFHHKAKGPVTGDSDIQVVKEDGEKKAEAPKIREKGSTENIVWSARLNLKNMLMGQDMESQW